MNYKLFADILWYFGHIITGVAIVINRYNFYIAVGLTCLGQFITIVSRPIGRIKNKTQILFYANT